METVIQTDKSRPSSSLEKNPNAISEEIKQDGHNEPNQNTNPEEGSRQEGNPDNGENQNTIQEDGEINQNTGEVNQTNDDDEYEDVEIEEEEPVPEEEWEQMKEEILNKNPDDTTDPPRTRTIKKMIRRKKEIVESPTKDDEYENNPLILFIKDKIELTSYSPEMWTKDHSRIVKNFLSDSNET
jgi:hypothetical protein